MMVFMAFSATAINYIDRANLGVAAPYIAKDLNLSPEATGALLGAFFWTYAAFQLPSGWFIDKVGARIAYAVAVVWWSLFTAATALARGFGSLFGMRLLLGVGEAPAYPANAKIVSEWFPRRERAFATSIFDSGNRVGTALSLPIVSAIIAQFGWRASFVITGLLGFVWTFFWLKIYRPPAEHPGVTPEELAYIESDKLPSKPVGEGETVRWRDLFRYRTIWGMMLGFFCLNFVIYFFSTWFPTYLVKARGFDLKQMGLVGMIPALVAVFGGYLGGYVSDRLVRSGMRLSLARKIPLVGGMFLSSSIGLSVLVESTTAAIALMSLSYASLSFAAASIWALPADVAPTKDHVGSIGGIQNFASNLAGVCITTFVGVMLARTGGFVVPLVVAGCFSLLGAFSYLVIVPEIKPLEPRPRKAS
ncbi:MAG: MFS family permease [Verrucomicrobia bacterium]|jgi:MFS transporter, ACS family, D-galactonate transporter|nr:MAG: MFS family permease [Verrucomicrobiota bacterium]